MATTPAAYVVRDDLNNALPGRISDTFKKLGLGDLLNLFIQGMAATESGVSASSNKITMANAASSVFDVNVTAGTVTGRKKLRIGQITGPNALVPATGEVIWDGVKTLLFSSADAVTTATLKYATAGDATTSALQAATDRS